MAGPDLNVTEAEFDLGNLIDICRARRTTVLATDTVQALYRRYLHPASGPRSPARRSSRRAMVTGGDNTIMVTSRFGVVGLPAVMPERDGDTT